MTDTTEMVNRAELDLLVLVRRVRGACTVIPYGPYYTAALAVGQALIDRLYERGLEIKVEARRAGDGIALVMQDVTPLAAATG